MKKLFVFTLLSTVAGMQQMKAQEAYAVYTEGNTTLTFYYDDQRSTRSGTTYDMNVAPQAPGWNKDGNNDKVTQVVFDDSFAEAHPTATCAWFMDMTELTSIQGLQNLNTSEVTNMANMFLYCRKLKSIDLSNFNTAKVRYLGDMFTYCESLTTIYVGGQWSTSAVTNSEDMFEGCTQLVGGAGTAYDADHTDASYAHIDGGTSNPGYFSSRPWDIVVDGIYYKGLGYGNLAVTYKDEDYGTYSGDIVIPASVETDVYSYTVTTIGEKAFYQCPYLENVTLPATIDRIETNAFYDAFFDANRSTVTCLATTPPTISPYAFDSAIENLTLYVPAGCTSAYQSSSVWGGFGNIYALGYDFEADGIYYKKTGEGTVSVTYKDRDFNSYSGDVVIPETISFNDVTYTVTAIADSAFRNSTDLTSVTIPATVSAIGIRAFAGCEELETGDITCHATEPPAISTNTFDTDCYKGASAYVPYGCYDAYSQAVGWKNFSDLYEFKDFVSYDLWIAGTQATENNCDDILGDGTVSFDASTSTLTLNNADIERSEGHGIESKVTDIKIVLTGENHIKCHSGMGIYIMPGTKTGVATFLGGGSLYIEANIAGLRSGLDLYLTDNVNITSESSGLIGLQGWKASTSGTLPSLTITGENTVLRAKGAYAGVYAFHALTLKDGNKSIEPEGATFVEDSGIMKDDTPVAGEWVAIRTVEKYDLWIAGTQATESNCNDILGDGTVSFDPETNTLTLTDANIVTDEDNAINSTTDIEIKLEGENTLNGSVYGISASHSSNTTISGPGSLHAIGSNGGIVAIVLNIKDGAQVTAEGTAGESSGIRAWNFTAQGTETVVMMKGSETAFFGATFTLEDGLIVGEPENAHYRSGGLMGVIEDADGKPVQDEWVVIGSEDYIAGIDALGSEAPHAIQYGAFNLAGQRVGKDYKGIAIRNGRKVLLR